MWTITVVMIIAFYESTKYLQRLIQAHKVRPPMLLLFLCTVYPHYYTWWSFFNAWNDEYFEQFFHQLVFSITELISTLLVVKFCHRDCELDPRSLLAIMSVASLHILASCTDQFVTNVIEAKGQWHQTTRDLGFMIVDALHILIPAIELVNYANTNKIKVTQVINCEELSVSVLSIFLLWLVLLILWYISIVVDVYYIQLSLIFTLFLLRTFIHTFISMINVSMIGTLLWVFIIIINNMVIFLPAYQRYFFSQISMIEWKWICEKKIHKNWGFFSACLIIFYVFIDMFF